MVGIPKSAYNVTMEYDRHADLFIQMQVMFRDYRDGYEDERTQHWHCLVPRLYGGMCTSNNLTPILSEMRCNL